MAASTSRAMSSTQCATTPSLHALHNTPMKLLFVRVALEGRQSTGSFSSRAMAVWEQPRRSRLAAVRPSMTESRRISPLQAPTEFFPSLYRVVERQSRVHGTARGGVANGGQLRVGLQLFVDEMQGGGPSARPIPCP